MLHAAELANVQLTQQLALADKLHAAELTNVQLTQQLALANPQRGTPPAASTPITPTEKHDETCDPETPLHVYINGRLLMKPPRSATYEDIARWASYNSLLKPTVIILGRGFDKSRELLPGEMTSLYEGICISCDMTTNA